ncbi:hexosaminidase D isoform X2 [Bradysia coprophila]|nr:hexosaminidase D isoform X2 [Bradysia coprophila]
MQYPRAVVRKSCGRQTMLILSSASIFLICVWALIAFYTTETRPTTREATSHQSLNKDTDIYAKYGGIYNKNGVKYVPPTRSPYISSLSRYKDQLKYLDTSFFSKDSEKILKTLDVPFRDEMILGREAERIRHSAELQRQYEHELQRLGVPIIAGIGRGGHAPPNQRLVHLDLKGAPPKISYLKRLLPIFKSLGATGLLLEYEDMFPYSSSLRNLSAKNAYSTTDVKELLHAAAAVGLSVMPLIQTFAHLEFALKLPDFQHLREVPESPQSICPSLNASLVFIEEMMAQVVDMHQTTSLPTTSRDPLVQMMDIDDDLLTPNFTHLHIGCDEVFRMGECPRCKSRGTDELFLSHVRTVANIVKRRWPHLKIVIWDDMLRRMHTNDLQKSGIGDLVEPMIWVYAEDVYRFIPSQTWEKYASVFRTAWIASSFKGAHGEQLIIPPARRHLENNLAWLAVFQSEGARFSQGISGFALTGWQRYDHFAVLCELLPVSMPSLAICLSTVAKGYFNVEVGNNAIFSALTCPEPASERLIHRPWMELHQDSKLSSFSKCMFPGSPIFRFVHHLTAVTSETREYIDSLKYKRGWMTEYNIRHNFSSPIRVDELTADAMRLKNSLDTLANNANEAMHDVYDKWTIKEFIELHIKPLMDELNDIEKKGSILSQFKVWPRRPLPYQLERK